ncbi:MAG TPA: TlpA disulfide reductase family protein, partial [Saprospiraceae bacterium]|nr:TlpA disulfide reductase family protein [Saprospiraceae bacterium]
ILGTWCPNCRDEQLFLSEYLRRHPEQAAQMAVVGFAFERHKTAAEANAHLSAYKQKLGIPFDIVHAGKNNKDVAAAYFPSLSRVMAFPTMIVLDKRNQVRRIHTGFDGPATSKYAEFEQEFGRLIGALIEEK